MEQEYLQSLVSGAVATLQELIQIPSLSREEERTASLLEQILLQKEIAVHRTGNNVWAKNARFDPSLSSVLLNSHHDTVPPAKGYTRDPYQASVVDGKLYGLGSNDAGGSLVSLLAAFLYFYDAELPFNIIFAASAEEEISGKNGIELLLKELPPITMGIVGEPTQMKLAVAEKGLLVIDCHATGITGHAARDEGSNALYKAVDDISRIRDYQFEKVSDLLGPVHMAVTSVETENKSHNMIPDSCSFVVDIRVNECYTFDEVLTTLSSVLQSRIEPRSLRLKPSGIAAHHPLVQAAQACGMQAFGSATLSDMALMDFPAVKLGPGDSLRSHTADEYIYLEEIEKGVEGYIELLNNLSQLLKT